MSRSLRSWLCTLAIVFAPTVAFALPPCGAQLKNSVGLQARCPLADGTWQLDQILNQMSATPQLETQSPPLETHDMAHPKDLPLMTKLEGEIVESEVAEAEIVEPEIVTPEIIEHVTESTESIHAAATSSVTANHSHLLEEYLPYDLRSDDCMRYQSSPSASWIRYRSTTPQLRNAEPIKIVVRAQPCMVVDAESSVPHPGQENDDAAQQAAYLLSLWKHGTIQRDARWILDRSVASYVKHIERFGSWNAAVASQPIHAKHDLTQALALAAEQLPAVCTPPSTILIAPHQPAILETESLAGTPPTWDQLAEVSLDLAAAQLEGAANLLRQTSHVLKQKSHVARNTSTNSERR